MSHVVVVKIAILDLDALRRACKNLGLEFKENQETYKWYGRHVGDYPMPEGFTKQDLGKCDHAIGIPGDRKAYEIGVVKSKDGSESYQLLWDFWQGGFGLQAKVGNNCDKLTHEYAKEVTKAQCQDLINAGWDMDEEYNSQTGETTFTLHNYQQSSWN